MNATVSSGVQAVIFDWAGTMIDFGSRAPAGVFRAVFRERGIEITDRMARGPMGMAKRDHIAAIAAIPEVAEAWRNQYGRACSDADVDAMYEDFLPMQKETLLSHSQLIPGAADAAAECRRRGIGIGSSTGYTRELMDVVAPAAAEQGYSPDVILCAEDAPAGRPAPFLIYEAAIRLGRWPLASFVKVDDTTVGIEAGRNAGCWTVGITRSGNGVGLSEDELYRLPDAEADALCAEAALQLKTAGAHCVLDSVADFVPVLDRITQLLETGHNPQGVDSIKL